MNLFRFEKQLVGRAVRAARLGIGYSLRDLATRAGISDAHVCRIEAGEWDIRLGTFMKVALAMGATPGDLIERGILVDETVLLNVIREGDDYGEFVPGTRHARQWTIVSIAQFCATAAYLLKSSDPVKTLARFDFPLKRIETAASKFARTVAEGSDVDRRSLLDELASEPCGFARRFGFLSSSVMRSLFAKGKSIPLRWGHPGLGQ